jgi:hypothetical protein
VHYNLVALVMLLVGMVLALQVLAPRMSNEFTDVLDVMDAPASGAGLKNVRMTPSHYLKVVRFRLAASVTQPAAPALNAQGLARMVTFRHLDGSDTPRVVEGNVLKLYQEHLTHTDEDYNEIPNIVGAQVGTWNGQIWVADPSLQYPMLSAEDLRAQTDPKIQVQWNGTAYGNKGGELFTSASIAFETAMEEVAADLEVGRLNPWRRFHTYQIDDLKTATADQRRRFDFGYHVSRLFFVVETNPAAGTAIAQSNALVTSIELLVNGRRRGISNWVSLQAALRGLGGANYPPKTGCGLIDFDPHKTLDLGTMLDLTGARSFEIAFTTGAFGGTGCKVWVLQEDIVEPDYALIAGVQARLKAQGRI